MKYKVEGCIVPELTDAPEGMEYKTVVATDASQLTFVSTFSKWYVADNHLDAASMFILDYPEVNCATILVVGKDYSLGQYPLDGVKLNADYICGLRWEDEV